MMKLHLLREENLAQEMESRVKPCFQAYGREKYYFREIKYFELPWTYTPSKSRQPSCTSFSLT